MPKQLHQQRLPVKATKWKHLQELKKVLPKSAYSFYDNIPHEKVPVNGGSDKALQETIMTKIKLVKKAPTKKSQNNTNHGGDVHKKHVKSSKNNK